jgi:hypothetical protein
MAESSRFSPQGHGYGTTVGHLFSKSKKSKLPPIFDQVLASTSRGLSFIRYELLASGTQALSRNNRTAPEAINYRLVYSNGNFSIRARLVCNNGSNYIVVVSL